MPKPHRTDLDDRVAAVVAIVRTNLRQEWNVAQMAAVAGVSGSHLRRIFAARIGITPRELLADLRFQAAVELLDDPAIRIKEIMTRIGVSDPSHFCRRFRRRFGVSPTEYRSLPSEARAIRPIKERIGLLTNQSS